jgi:hypothetical protein
MPLEERTAKIAKDTRPGAKMSADEVAKDIVDAAIKVGVLRVSVFQRQDRTNQVSACGRGTCLLSFHNL